MELEKATNKIETLDAQCESLKSEFRFEDELMRLGEDRDEAYRDFLSIIMSAGIQDLKTAYIISFLNANGYYK